MTSPHRGKRPYCTARRRFNGLTRREEEDLRKLIQWNAYILLKKGADPIDKLDYTFPDNLILPNQHRDSLVAIYRRLDSRFALLNDPRTTAEEKQIECNKTIAELKRVLSRHFRYSAPTIPALFKDMPDIYSESSDWFDRNK